jgi:hypothetical protein
MIPATKSRRIMQESCGKVTVSFMKAPELTGTGRFRAGLYDLGSECPRNVQIEMDELFNFI